MTIINQTESIIILNFETTGLYPDNGDRVIETGAILLRNQKIVDRFQSLVHPGFFINHEIEAMTGISSTCSARHQQPRKCWKSL